MVCECGRFYSINEMHIAYCENMKTQSNNFIRDISATSNIIICYYFQPKTSKPMTPMSVYQEMILQLSTLPGLFYIMPHSSIDIL